MVLLYGSHEWQKAVHVVCLRVKGDLAATVLCCLCHDIL